MTHSRIWAELRMNHPSFTAEEQYPLPTYILAENSNNKNSTVSTFNSLLDHCYARINVKPRRGGGVGIGRAFDDTGLLGGRAV